ncbi:MAG: N-acetylmuramoyl-L-alanine amidase [Clostridia bacterium]|nr:N-acetylmuramoyl-L-alanine amidase [Clostridia bacterium]
MFIILKKKHIILFSVILIFIILAIIFISTIVSLKAVNVKPQTEYVIIVDAGHGGIDGGSVGKGTGVTESELNLRYAKNLSNQLKRMGISCLLTRENDAGLYDKDATNLKRSDMKRRREIIQKYKPQLVVSIHMNSFPLSSSRGAQAFYKKGSEQGKIFADCIQKQLSTTIEKTGVNGKVGDYYIVNCTDIPAVLIECGFLSNLEEEQLLVTKEYENKVCYLILCGIVSYLNSQNGLI